jgi:hypothetical protein
MADNSDRGGCTDDVEALVGLAERSRQNLPARSGAEPSLEASAAVLISFLRPL